MAYNTGIYVDETTAPVLDPGKGKTRTGYLWARFACLIGTCKMTGVEPYA